MLALGFSLLGILSETQQNAARPAEAGYLFSLNGVVAEITDWRNAGSLPDDVRFW